MRKSKRARIEAVAREAGIDPRALLAVIAVESGGRFSARVGGRLEPLIRFEGHYFDRLLTPGKRERARAAGLSSPKAGAVKNPAGQAARWALLERAAAIDRQAAYAATSWGVGQVMGDHWKRLGYDSVEALVADARSGPEGQARLMVRFIAKAKLAQALNRRDWAGFARAYNGPAYARNGYDAKLAAAYERLKEGDGAADARAASGSDRTGTLRRGSRGEAVADLQRRLNDEGAALAVDGSFGPATERAVRAFQQRHGLDVDGIVGPLTQAALAPRTGLLARLIRMLRGLVPP